MSTTSTVQSPAPPTPSLEVERIRADFPILGRQVHGKPLVYFDNAATVQKPRAVIEAMVRFYTEDCANIHRGAHALSERASAAYESARATVRRFVNAHEEREIVFVCGTTEALNLVAHSFARPRLQPGDEVIVSVMEHHSNLVPWQIACAERGATLRVVPIDDGGELLLSEYARLLGPRTKLVALTHVSNVLGTINPVRQLITLAHGHNVPVLLDGAQAAPHLGLDVQDLDCDFYAFSGHKVYGPTGIGVLYGKAGLLDTMPPYQSGGGMISAVTIEKTTYAEIPNKFEAGTPNVAGAVGLAAALDYVSAIGLDAIAAYEQELLAYAKRRLAALPQVRLIGTAAEKAGIVSFALGEIHPHDVATVLDREGIAIRAGHHCAQPLMARLGVAATARASLAFYNTRAEIEALGAGLGKVIEVFK
ncbi:MAG: cysteine desulfurase [Deltaproteobacteria bacterium]|nr:cysteine desulfurase [Deltaproteobacteria bacterium]